MKNYEWFAEKANQAILLNSLACQESFGIAGNNIAFCDNENVIFVSEITEVKETFCNSCIFSKYCKKPNNKLDLAKAKILWLAADHKE